MPRRQFDDDILERSAILLAKSRRLRGEELPPVDESAPFPPLPSSPAGLQPSSGHSTQPVFTRLSPSPRPSGATSRQPTPLRPLLPEFPDPAPSTSMPYGYGPAPVGYEHAPAPAALPSFGDLAAASASAAARLSAAASSSASTSIHSYPRSSAAAMRHTARRGPGGAAPGVVAAAAAASVAAATTGSAAASGAAAAAAGGGGGAWLAIEELLSEAAYSLSQKVGVGWM